MTQLHRYSYVLFAAILSSVPCTVVAQSFAEAPTSNIEPSRERDTSLGFSNGSFIAVPIPSQDPTFGTGLALLGGYLFQADEESSNSFIGIGAYGTSNDSKAYGFAASVAFDQNRWKATVIGAEVDLFYDLFILGEPVPLNQEGELASLEFSYGLTPDISVGLGFRYLSTDIEPDLGFSLPPALEDDLGTEIASFGLLADWDRRDDTFYPTTGTNLSFDVYQHVVEGSSREYQKTVLTFDAFEPFGDDFVLAGRAAACASSDDAPFFDSCSLGGVDGFRGFQVTENIGSRLFSLQASFRGRFNENFGYELFAGAGRVEDTGLAEDAGKTRYAGGLGVRYRLTEKFPLDLAVDATLNDAGDDIFYIRVGQAF